MEYHLEIYRPGSCASDGLHKNLYCGEPILADSRRGISSTLKRGDVEVAAAPRCERGARNL